MNSEAGTVAAPAGDELSAANRSTSKRARIAVSIAFASNGFLFGTWAPRIPEIKHDLGLSSAGLGLALLAPAVGSIASMRLVGRLCARYGTAATTRIASLIFFALAWLPGLAPNLATLWVALFAWGASIGTMDVAMNAQGITVEGAYRRPVLSGFHAAWSIGTFTGALVGALGAGRHVPISVQQAVLGSVLAAIAVFADRAFLPDPAAVAGPTGPSGPGVAAGGRARRWPRPRWPDGRLALLGIATIFAMVSEGAVADWSGVLLRDHLHVSPGRVGFAFAAFGATMTAGRLVGDRVVHAFGRRRCIATLSVIGAAGVGTGLALDSLVWVVAGFALLGLGLSVMVPVLFSAAADGVVVSGPAIATVASFGYCGFLIGPALIGLIAQGVNVQFALWLLPLFTLTAGALGYYAIGRPPPDAADMIDVAPDRFEEMVATALDGLPPALGKVMRNVAVTVDNDSPQRRLLGLYEGVPLTERTHSYSAVLPDRITIYRQAICAICRSEDQVVEEVRRTVIHEVGHHFGIGDERLHELGW